ncbi:MAG: polysaccharide biosynthesis tyrosine autokinase [Cellvibrionaceae bacterium]|nr:polysaccharide biosynthesis tyrosine autokinase [Cellvibrionaceae bacterium]
MEKSQPPTEALPIDLFVNGLRNALFNKWKILTIVTIITVGAYFRMDYSPRKYGSDVTLSISGAISADSSLVNKDRPDGGIATTKAYLNTQYELLLSRDMFEQVYPGAKNISCHLEQYAEPGTKGGFEFDPEKHIVIEPVRNTDLISIQALCRNPEAARDLADFYAQEFIKLKLREFQTERERVTSWRRQEVTRLKTILEQSEAELYAFRESQRVYSSQKNTELNDADVQRLREALAAEEEKRVRLVALKNQLSTINADDIAVDSILSIASLTDDATLEFLVMELSKVSTSLNANKKIYQDEHPNILEDQIRYEETLQQIRTRIAVSSGGLDREIALADTSIRSIRRELSQLNAQFLTIDRKVSTLATLEQNVDINQEMYRSFIEQTNSIVLSLGFVGDQIKIVGKAFVNPHPASPNIEKNTVLAFVISMFMFVLYFVVRGARDPSMKHPDDVRLTLDSEILGYLPNVKTKRSKMAYNGYNVEPGNIFSEAVRSLRTSLQLVDLDVEKKITIITSSISHEGKSTVAMNLAAACGQVEKVLLIDCDIRRETLSRSLSIEPGSHGLVNVLSKERGVAECIVSDASPFYQFLSAGSYATTRGPKKDQVPHSRVEMLSVEKLKKLFEILQQDYDHIIVDCPPICGVSDAKIVAACATHVIYVVAAFQTPSKIVQHGFRELKSCNIDIAGVVMNKIDINKARAYTNMDYYGYGYA